MRVLGGSDSVLLVQKVLRKPESSVRKAVSVWRRSEDELTESCVGPCRFSESSSHHEPPSAAAYDDDGDEGQ